MPSFVHSSVAIHLSLISRNGNRSTPRRRHHCGLWTLKLWPLELCEMQAKLPGREAAHLPWRPRCDSSVGAQGSAVCLPGNLLRRTPFHWQNKRLFLSAFDLRKKNNTGRKVSREQVKNMSKNHVLNSGNREMISSEGQWSRAGQPRAGEEHPLPTQVLLASSPTDPAFPFTGSLWQALVAGSQQQPWAPGRRREVHNTNTLLSPLYQFITEAAN